MTLEDEIDELMDYSRSIAEVAESESDEANRMSAEYFADYYKQLAEWLRELQAWRKAYDDCVNTDYESIDDSVRRLTIIGQVVNVRNVFADIRRTDNKNG